MIKLSNFKRKGKCDCCGKIRKVTQEYLPSVNMGHYKYVISDKKGHILKISSSCCTPPKGKIDDGFLKCELNRFWMDYKLSIKGI